MIRFARHYDMDKLVELGHQFSSESDYPFNFDEIKYRENMSEALSNESLLVLVYEHEGDVKGMLVGAVAQTAFSLDKVAMELAWYVVPGHRGLTPIREMISLYENWAYDQGCVAITLSDINSLRNLGKVYERFGYTLTENTYTKRIL